MCLLGYIRDSFCAPLIQPLCQRIDWRTPNRSKLPSLCERYNDFCHCKPSELLRVVERRCRLSTWSFRCNLALHPKKTKVMLLSTPQMSQTHGLDGHCIHLCANGKSLQRVLTFRLLGTEVHENVNWKRAINCRSQVVTELCLYWRSWHTLPRIMSENTWQSVLFCQRSIIMTLSVIL